ncbi:MAG: BMP family ABC transporter substrate-binding protein [Acidimicrobiia bacterium]
MTVAAVMALAAFGASNTAGAGSKKKPNAGLVLSGEPNDGGYYQDTFEAFKKAAKKFGFKAKSVSNVGFDTDAVADAIGNLVNTGSKFVVADGTMTASGEVAAEEFPETPIFLHTSPVPEGISNYQGYVVEQGVAAYVLGALAVEITSSDKVGVLGGFEDPPSGQAVAGFTAGAESASSSIEVSSVIVGDYSDPVLAKAAAAAMIANGVDVIYGYLDAGLVGVSQAIDESGEDVQLFSATGSTRADKARCAANSTMVAQAFQNIDAQFEQMFSDFEEGNVSGGNTFWRFEDPNLQKISFCKGKATAALKKLAKQVIADINSGDVELGSEITGE